MKSGALNFGLMQTNKLGCEDARYSTASW